MFERNVIIREFEINDAESHSEAVKSSINSLSTWFTWVKPSYCLCDSKDFIKSLPGNRKNGKYEYAILYEGSDQILGACGLTMVQTYENKKIASMNYWVRADKQGKE